MLEEALMPLSWLMALAPGSVYHLGHRTLPLWTQMLPEVYSGRGDAPSSSFLNNHRVSGIFLTFLKKFLQMCPEVLTN